MASQDCKNAIKLAVQHKNALMKKLSWNDVSDTANQCGFYLPKEAWRFFTPHRPVVKENKHFDVSILWPDGIVTNSCIHWWGKKKDEFHLTRFNRIRQFHWRRPELAGGLFVLVRTDHASFAAFVLTNDDDMEEIQARLGVEVVSRWTTYPMNQQSEILDEEDCVAEHFRNVVATMNRLPQCKTFAKHAREAVDKCTDGKFKNARDIRLMKYMHAEYQLFQRMEEKVYGSKIAPGFQNMQTFIDIASPILNSRKSRAGKSLENHVQHLLAEASIPFEAQVRSIKGKPDIIIPNAHAYTDKQHPRDRICVLGIKRTCKDRWRQVTREAPDVPHKHILTLQEGMSKKQMEEMRDENITLVVPEGLHECYPEKTDLKIMTVEEFFQYARDLAR